MNTNKDYVGYISFSQSLADHQVHVDSWDEAYLCSEGCGGRLEKLVHKGSGNIIMSREHYNIFISSGDSSLNTTYTIVPSDVENNLSYTDEQKQSIIADMLVHFKSVHDKRNQELVDSGYGNDLIPFDEVSIQELKDYALSGTVWGKI